MKLLIKLLALVFTALGILSCDSTESVDELKPGRRDYVWTIDTIDHQSAELIRMWGSSPTDVWATSDGDHDKSIAHFLGQQWSFYGVTGLWSVHSIFGFAPNDVYIAGAGNEVWRYDGSNWTKFAEIIKDGHTNLAFNDLWGKNPNDFYVFGGYPDSSGAFNNTVIAHYNNNKWTVLESEGINGVGSNLYGSSKEDVVYVLTYKLGGWVTVDSSIIYEYLNGVFNKIYSSVWTGGKQADISLINDEVYFILGQRIAKRVNGQFQTVLQVDNLEFYQSIWGRNSKDIFLMMKDGLVHYNGSDMVYMQRFNKRPTHILGAALFQKEVFFLVLEASTHLNFIYHGILN